MVFRERQRILRVVEEPVETGGLSFRAPPAGRSTETIRIERTRGFSRLLSPRELWRFRDVAWQIATRDVKVRYRQTLLGAAWAVLQPVATMVVFSLFFGHLAHLSSEGVPYPLYSLAGLVPWTTSRQHCCSAPTFVANGPLVARSTFRGSSSRPASSRGPGRHDIALVISS
jgi:lipopolysaccharide transport system permease protein